MDSIRLSLVAALALSVSLAVSGLGAQAEPTAAVGCQSFVAPIQRLGGGNVSDPHLESCPGGVVDVTPAPNGPRAGELTVLSMGRYQNKQVPFLFRGVPNTAYPFAAVYLHDLAGHFLYDDAPHPLSTLAHALPFQPKQVVSLGDLGDGHTGYGYTDLEIVPSRAREAYPLNRQSVLIAIDGYNFVSPRALPSFLAQAAPQERKNPYMEVVYFQMDDPVHTLRRALIPVYRRASVEPEWSKIAAGNHAFDVGPNRAAQQAYVEREILAILAGVREFNRSLADPTVGNGRTCKTIPVPDGDGNYTGQQQTYCQ